LSVNNECFVTGKAGAGAGAGAGPGVIANVPAVFVIVFPNDPDAPSAVSNNTVSGIAVTIAVDAVKFAVYLATPFT